jgi:hypothetical protein
MTEEREESAEEQVKGIIRGGLYSVYYGGLSGQEKVRVAACIHQHKEDIYNAFRDEFPSYCRDSCPIEGGIGFCSLIYCLLKGNNTHELLKTVGREEFRDSGILEAIDSTNSRGEIEKKVFQEDDLRTMLRVQGMNLPEEHPFLEYITSSRP